MVPRHLSRYSTKEACSLPVPPGCLFRGSFSRALSFVRQASDFVTETAVLALALVKEKGEGTAVQDCSTEVKDE